MDHLLIFIGTFHLFGKIKGIIFPLFEHKTWIFLQFFHGNYIPLCQRMSFPQIYIGVTGKQFFKNYIIFPEKFLEYCFIKFAQEKNPQLTFHVAHIFNYLIRLCLMHGKFIFFHSHRLDHFHKCLDRKGIMLHRHGKFLFSVIAAQNGNTLYTTIDANIQSIVEDKIKLFSDTYANNAREGLGAENIAVVIENPKNGEILAMANYPNFDLNDPKNMKDYYTQEQLNAMSDDDTLNSLNKLWQNFCVTHTYEPGSVQKPFTVACGLDTGTLTTDMTFLCDGYEMFGSEKVSCVNRSGHGLETLEKALMDSCNDALMQMSYKIGAENFLYYQSVFGFGQKTGVDLPGEANTSTLMYTLDNIKPVDLATNVFGQNYNCTMIEMVSAFSSLVNGGNYYQPHVVKKIADDNGNTVKTIEPTLLKKTVSENTSATLKNYLQNVVANGTGKVAKVDGYSMGGKTGTAQMYDETTHLRKRGSYLVSFIGCVPAQDPQLVIYTVIDQPNVQDQPHSNYAQNLTREILKEVLPYMNIYPDEEQTGVNADLTITGTNPPTGEKVTQEGEQGE